MSSDLFAPEVESSLAGAGWQDSYSQSVAARHVIRQDFAGLGSSALEVVVHHRHRAIAADPLALSVLRRVEGFLRASPDVSSVEAPRPKVSISTSGRTAVVTAGAATGTNQMVSAASKLAKRLARLGTGAVRVTLTGAGALRADFSSTNHSAMMRSEMLSWPVTMAILAVAFASGLGTAPNSSSSAMARTSQGTDEVPRRRERLRVAAPAAKPTPSLS